jgi:diguanylate cyclase (GGDEF)-like protein
MESSNILIFIKKLTAQKNKGALIKSFIEVFELFYTNSQVRIYEICRIRNEGDRKNHLVAIDTQDYEQFIEITNKEDSLNGCVSGRKIIIGESKSENIRIRYYPILSKNDVVYIIEIEQPAFEDTIGVIIETLVSIFSDLLKLLHSKDHDPLTGLMNRMAYNDFMNVIEVEPHKHISYASDQKPFTAIGLLDIDFFKRVNDNFGHLIGDEVLLIFSQIIKTVFRHNDLLFRYGGEEFIVILKDVNREHAKNVFERCRVAIETHEFPKVENVTASIGFALIDENISPHIIVDRADVALYYAKENGRNRVCCYDKLVTAGKVEPVEPHEKLIDLQKI